MSILDEIKLPKGSPKEELEQLSKDKLRPLFDIGLFEFRPEEYRDKGLDLAIELKYKGSNTNFRFLVQLKSTETKEPNSDGSYSWQIDTSNIQYLLNGGLPAYYICYVKQNDTFYFRQINDFINEISQKNKDWNSQDSHTLRTSDILNKDSISVIYEEVKSRCEKTREVTERLHLTRKEDKSNKVSITSEYQITDETSIVDLIEKIGLTIINEGRSKEIVLLSEKISNDITSPLFNLTVGIAHYYTSNLFDALAFFQKSKRQKDELPINLREHLEYFDAICKYSTGYINQQEYSHILDSLKDSEHLSYYIKIENAKDKYANSLSTDSFEILKKELFEIIDNNQIETSIRFIAGCEFLLHWGSKNNMDHFRSIALVNAIESETGPNQKLRIENAKEWLLKNQEWEKYYQKLNTDIVESKDIFAFNMCKLNEVKVRFELLVFTSIVKLEDNIPGMPSAEDIDNTDTFNTILKNLDIIANNYKNLYHIDNLLATLSTKFEVLDFIGNVEDSKSVAKEMQELIEFHGLKEQKRKLDYLLDNGSTKDNLLKLVQNTVGKSKSDKDEYESLINEMKLLDEKEISELQSDSDLVTVELFPISHFSISKNRLDEFYEVLKIDSYKLTKHLDYFFDNGIIPVLNIFNEIKEEGYANGKLDDKGIESWRKIRDIRVALYEKKFVRKKIKYGR
ncbi:MAG TPA: DUF4365 domain-containing protein [Edaphocola sp.]|nr:DUF4365 domain-containing protein [Edaphocola sp.]